METDTSTVAARNAPAGDDLRARASAVGLELLTSLRAVLDELPGSPQGPQQLARGLKLDKVLTSRLLKALRAEDPLTGMHRSPGPAPLSRFLQAARTGGEESRQQARAAAAVDRFKTLIKSEFGDRSGLTTVLSAWVPEARVEFELRRKQAAFRTMSELKGVSTDTRLTTALLHPSEEPGRLDIIWIHGHLGLRRLRPGAGVHFSTRIQGSFPDAPAPAGSLQLGGMRLDEYCSAPRAPLQVCGRGADTQYLLGACGFGPRSGVDLLHAEIRREALGRRTLEEDKQPLSFYTCSAAPARRLQLDVFIHDSILSKVVPALQLYDTSLHGLADPGDPSRDIDRLEMAEELHSLEMHGGSHLPGPVPRYSDLLHHVFSRVRWQADHFLGWRAAIEYPLHSVQVVQTYSHGQSTED